MNYKPRPQSYSRKEIADGLKEAAAFLFFRQGYSCTFEIGIAAWGSRRADVIANKINGHLVMIEVKSSVEDFKRDTKWPEYMRARVVDKFFFIFTEEVWGKIQANPELAKRIGKTPGVLLLSPHTGYAYVKKRPMTIDIPVENRITMLARLAWRKGDLSKSTQRRRKRIFLKLNTNLVNTIRH